MQKNEQSFEPWTGYYKIEHFDTEHQATEKELFDTVFAKLGKIQRQAVLEKIQKAEAQLAHLENELNVFLARMQ